MEFKTKKNRYSILTILKNFVEIFSKTIKQIITPVKMRLGN